MRKLIGAVGLCVLLGGCGPAEDAPLTSTTEAPYCQHVWQTGYDAVGKLVIGHPMTPCHFNEGDHADGVEGEVGIWEAPLPGGLYERQT